MKKKKGSSSGSNALRTRTGPFRTEPMVRFSVHKKTCPNRTEPNLTISKTTKPPEVCQIFLFFFWLFLILFLQPTLNPTGANPVPIFQNLDEDQSASIPNVNKVDNPRPYRGWVRWVVSFFFSSSLSLTVLCRCHCCHRRTLPAKSVQSDSCYLPFGRSRLRRSVVFLQ